MTASKSKLRQSLLFEKISLATLVHDVVENGEDFDDDQVEQITGPEPEDAPLDRQTLAADFGAVGGVLAVLGVLLWVGWIGHYFLLASSCSF